MRTSEWVTKLQIKNVVFRLEGERVKISAPPEVMTVEVKQWLSQRKGELLTYLQATAKPATDYRERYEERAAIMQFDGGLNKAQAEAAAYEDTLQQWIYDHPPQPLQHEHCCQCNAPLPIDSYMAYGHTVLCNQGEAATCFNQYLQSRRSEAIAALAVVGINVT